MQTHNESQNGEKNFPRKSYLIKGSTYPLVCEQFKTDSLNKDLCVSFFT